jgi:hypothetical protein
MLARITHCGASDLTQNAALCVKCLNGIRLRRPANQPPAHQPTTQKERGPPPPPGRELHWPATPPLTALAAPAHLDASATRTRERGRSTTTPNLRLGRASSRTLRRVCGPDCRAYFAPYWPLARSKAVLATVCEARISFIRKGLPLTFWRRVAIAAPAACPACGCEHSVAGPPVERVAGDAVERTGRVRQCVRCACTYAAMRSGEVLATRPQMAARQAAEPQAAPGGHGTGRPGGLDTDLWDPTNPREGR